MTAKRLVDITIAGGVLILTSPVQALVACAIYRSMGRPILFRQTRPGLGAKPFEMVKFRTMLPHDSVTQDQSNASRITPLGRLLRSTSVDELPSLWNVLKGDMSLVGPRPLLMHYVSRYSPEQFRRHEVRPGITGLAQVSGRNAITWQERLALDVEYVDRRSMRLDLNILARTMLKVVAREGISASAEQTMPEFMGDQTP